MLLKQKHCRDCGSAPINHTLTYLTVLIESISDPWTRWMSRLFPMRGFESTGPKLLELLAKLHIGYFTYSSNSSDSGRTQVLWEEANARGISLKEFHLFPGSGEIFISSFHGETNYFEVLPRPKLANLDALAWMDNKMALKTKLKIAGLPVARGEVAYVTNRAIKIFNWLRKPVIVKPNEGSRSRHTSIHIDTEKQLIRAFRKAKQLSPLVVIEEELKGMVYRATVVNKKLVATLRREPAMVIGNGKSTVYELVKLENRKPVRNGHIFYPLLMDKHAEAELARQGKTWRSKPKKGEIILLGQKTSRGAGGGITDVTKLVHKDNVALFEQVANILDDDLIGIDFIIQDISKSWKTQARCGVLECNSAPFIDLHHYPLIGKPQNVAGKIWDMIYPESKLKKQLNK